MTTNGDSSERHCTDYLREGEDRRQGSEGRESNGWRLKGCRKYEQVERRVVRKKERRFNLGDRGEST